MVEPPLGLRVSDGAACRLLLMTVPPLPACGPESEATCWLPPAEVQRGESAATVSGVVIGRKLLAAARRLEIADVAHQRGLAGDSRL